MLVSRLTLRQEDDGHCIRVDFSTRHLFFIPLPNSPSDIGLASSFDSNAVANITANNIISFHLIFVAWFGWVCFCLATYFFSTSSSSPWNFLWIFCCLSLNLSTLLYVKVNNTLKWHLYKYVLNESRAEAWAKEGNRQLQVKAKKNMKKRLRIWVESKPNAIWTENRRKMSTHWWERMDVLKPKTMNDGCMAHEATPPTTNSTKSHVFYLQLQISISLLEMKYFTCVWRVFFLLVCVISSSWTM